MYFFDPYCHTAMSRDLAHAETSRWLLTQGRALFWQKTQFSLIAEPRKLQSDRLIGVRDFSHLEKKICPRCIGHVIRRVRIDFKWWPMAKVITHKSRKDFQTCWRGWSRYLPCMTIQSQGFQIFGKIFPRTHGSRDTAHAQWLLTHTADITTH